MPLTGPPGDTIPDPGVGPRVGPDGGRLEPTVASASAAAWGAWIARAVRSGRARLGASGLAVVLGFALGLAALYVFAELAEGVAEAETQRLDAAALVWLRQFASPTLDVLARAASVLGSEAVAVFLVLLLVLFGRQGRWGAAAGLLVTTAGAQLLNNVLKDLFHRTRPAPVAGLIPAQAFSFPSGHAMVSAAFYLFVAYVGWRLLRGHLRAVWASAMVLVVLLIGLSRLYLGVHYLTDVVAGYAAGLVWADAVIVGGWLLGRSSRRRAPPANGPD